MKAHLMYPDRDWDLEAKLPCNADALMQDLELDTLLRAMAGGDRFLYEVARLTVLVGTTEPSVIVYRQALLRDCLENSAVIDSMYRLAVEILEKERKDFWGGFPRYTGGILHRAVGLLKAFASQLKILRALADAHAGKFQSKGFTTFFAMLQTELDDVYLSRIDELLESLRFRHGVPIGAQLGDGGKGKGYRLHDPAPLSRGWLATIFTREPPSFTFRLHPRDEGGARTLSNLRDRGISEVANALAQSADHIHSFFTMLRNELAFYIGCINLEAALRGLGMPVCLPIPVSLPERGHSAQGLYDPCLALTMGGSVVGNDLDADNRGLVMITGSNQGGKSTFLRSIGLSQLMMQAGMFVPSASFRANVCRGVFTHYKREEDLSMQSGKLDEELARMSQIADRLSAGALVLFNESFASTNEKEGSEIARQIIAALLDADVKIFFVTHFYDLASTTAANRASDVVFLRAQREAGGGRTFKLIAGAPLRTSYGEDLYRKIFHANDAGAWMQ